MQYMSTEDLAVRRTQLLKDERYIPNQNEDTD